MRTTSLSAIPFDQSDFACVDFVNSAFTDYRGSGQSIDRLVSPEWRAWFLDRHGLTPDSPGAPPLDRLITLRRDLRRVLDTWAQQLPLSARDVRLLDVSLRGAPLRLRVDRLGDTLALREEPLDRSWEWVVSGITASVVALVCDGDPARLKTCENPDCSWMFYDSSMNHSKQFCSTTPCGSLIRVRRFRQRG